jgi:hypothetical protein
VGFVLGFPAVVALALRRRLEVVEFLAADYKGGDVQRMWEVVDLVKKLLLTSAVLFVPEGSIERVGIALLLSGTFQVLQAYYQPYNSPYKNRMADAAGAALSLTYDLTLLVKASPLAQDQDALGALLIVLLVFVLCAGVTAVWAMRRQALAVLRKEQTLVAAGEDGMAMGELPSSVIANPAYEVDDYAEEESGASERVTQLEAELAATKREHSKYTSARIAAELEKAHAAHAVHPAELQAERERSAAEADELRAELAQLKKDE